MEVDQSGEVSYQALNAITSAMLTVKGKQFKKRLPHNYVLSFFAAVIYIQYKLYHIHFCLETAKDVNVWYHPQIKKKMSIDI